MKNTNATKVFSSRTQLGPSLKSQIDKLPSIVLISLLSMAMVACGGGGGGDDTDDVQNTGTAAPEDSFALSEVLVTPGATTVQGNIPATSNLPEQPIISRSEQFVSSSSGSQVVLPIDFQSDNTNISSLVYEVQGASSHARVDLNGAGNLGTAVLPINIPSSVSEGQFCIDVKLIDTNGLVSAAQEICVFVTRPLNCDTIKVSGGEGLTSTIHSMGGDVGTVSVDYQTFTIKDKIDVFQGGQWVAGTGPFTLRQDIRTALDCSQATEALGYVGQQGEFRFAYDPALGGDVEVVVSGCENGGTAWNYTASCPRDLRNVETTFHVVVTESFNTATEIGADFEICHQILATEQQASDAGAFSVGYVSGSCPTSKITNNACNWVDLGIPGTSFLPNQTLDAAAICRDDFGGVLQ